ncbi:MAG: TlpA family protein disulfide reductase [Gemmataceae bacterium]
MNKLRWRGWILGGLLCAASVSFVIAQTPKDDTPLIVAAKKYRKEAEEIIAKAKASTDPAERKILQGQLEKREEAFVTEAFEITSKNPASEDAYELYIELLTAEGKFGVMARDRIREHHANNPNIWMACVEMASTGAADVPAVLETIIQKNTTRKVRGIAQASLGLTYKRRAVKVPAAEQAKILQLASAAFATATKDYGDVQIDSGRKIAEFARDHLAGLENITKLAVGKPVPELTGVDLDGKPLKLSDYRGQVVLIDFWATWCPACMKLMPDAKELLKKYGSEGFAIVGVNMDTDPEDVPTAIKRHGITWKNFRGDNPNTPNMADCWNIDAFPAFALIDREGTIRYLALNEGADFAKITAEIQIALKAKK